MFNRIHTCSSNSLLIYVLETSCFAVVSSCLDKYMMLRCQVLVFPILVPEAFSTSNLGDLSFRDRFDILLEKRPRPDPSG